MIIVEPVEASHGLCRKPASCIGDLVSRIQEEERCFEDIVVDSRDTCIDPEHGRIRIGRHQEYELNDHSFAQLCSKLSIPTSYAHRCNNELFASNVNHWLHSENKQLLLRTSRNRLRAVLSDTYKVVNNSEVLGWLQNRFGASTPIRYELNDRYMDLQVIRKDPEHNMSDRGSEGLHRGIHVRNSEVGASKIMISTLIYREICLNGLIMSGGRFGYARRHVGSSDISATVREAFDNAMRLSAEAASSFLGTRGIRVQQPEKALEVIAQRYELSEDESAAIQYAYTVEPGNSLYAVINSVTRAGGSSSLTLDSRHKLQSLGGTLTELSSTGKWIDN